ncbi:MAG: protein BatD [Rhodopirellula sp.]|nr:protein BatD [Rhodopirellula sp.]
MIRLLATLALMVPTAAATAESPSITFRLETDRTYAGQPVNGSVSISNVPDAGRPEFKKSDDFEIVPIGGPADRSSMVIINGKTRSSSERTYRYRVTPRKTGKLSIPGPTLTVDGEVFAATDQSLEVLPATEQDVAFLEIEADRQAIYPVQEVEITLTVSVKELPPPFSEYEPVAVQTVPELTIPWLDRRQIPAGIEQVGDPGEWLVSVQSRSGTGFSVNGIGVDSPFTLFGNRTTSFHPKPSAVMRPNKDGIATRYWQYEFPQKFRAAKAGQYSFGPASLSGRFGISVNDQEQLETEKIFAVSKPIRIRVDDIPADDQPDSYVGAIGRFQATVDLSPRRVQVRDPMNLRITLRGHGTLENATPLDLGAVPAIAEHFAIHQVEQNSGDGFTSFIYDLRPLDADVKEFPSIPLAYFDVEQEKYVVLRTDPIPIEVAVAESLRADQIVAPPAGDSSNQAELQTRREGVFANIADPRAVRDESVRPIWWFAGLGGMAATYAALVAAVFAVRRSKADRASLRRRRAAARARGQLRQAQAELSAGKVVAGADAVHDAIVGLVADTADLPEAGLTGKDVREQLSGFGTEESLVDRVVAILDARDAARYGASHRDPAEMSRQAEEVIEEVVRGLESKGRLR